MFLLMMCLASSAVPPVTEQLIPAASMIKQLHRHKLHVTLDQSTSVHSDCFLHTFKMKSVIVTTMRREVQSKKSKTQ